MNIKHLDGLVNVVSGMGTGKAKRDNNQWQYGAFNDWTQLDAAYQSNWIARQIVDIPAQDMTREWRVIKSARAEELTAAEQEFGVQAAVQEALCWARLYGGAGILMITDQDLGKPFNMNRVKRGSLERLLVFDRHDLTPMSINTWDILSPNYLQPEFYTIRGGSQQIHWTHVVRFEGERLPIRQRLLTHGWGDSVLRKCIDDVSDTVAAKNGIAELMQEANIDVISREGLNEELASDQDSQIIDRYALFSKMKSIVNMALLDGDESYDRKTLQLSGVAPIIEQFITWISGAARIPVTKLFGTSAKGMNATGEGDLKTYYDDVRAEQVSKLTKPMRYLDQVVARSIIGSMPSDFDYIWLPLSQPSIVETEQANLLRAQKDEIYLGAGIVQRSQIMRNLQSNEEYQFDDDALTELEEMEDGDLFETLPELPAPESEPQQSDQDFVDRYQAFIDAGMSHDEAVEKATGR